MSRVLFLFLDGVGIGPADPAVNPFLRARLPTLSRALGGRLPTLDEPLIEGPGGRAFPVDACLGIPGLPQSGTGHITLLTGHNAAQLFGRHFGPWVPVQLRPLLDRENLLVLAAQRGARVVFANAYPAGYPNGRRDRRIAGVVAAALSANILTRDHEALAAGAAVASEIVNDGWIEKLGRVELPRVTAEAAGRNLARIARAGDLTMFAHYLTDAAGHEQSMPSAVSALECVDRFLGSILSMGDPELRTVVFSDHGNIEDIRSGHTRHPSLGLVFGEDAGTIRDTPERLTGVRDFLLRMLELDEDHPTM